MITWQLWRAIRRPTPLMCAFAWAVPERTPRRTRRPLRWRNVLLALLAVGALFALSPSLLVAGTLGILALPLASACFSGILLGMMTAARTSVGVARLRESKSWDVVRSTPLGAWQSAWAIAVISAAHVRTTLSGRVLTWLVRVVGVVGVLLAGASALSLLGDETRAVAREFAPYATFFLWIVVDHVQAQLFACLWGLLAAGMAHSSTEARLLAFGGFALARLSGFALLWGVLNVLYITFGLAWRDDALLISAGLGVLLYACANELALQVLRWAAQAWYARVYA